MRIHLIACGGAVMHNMTIALHLKGNMVTGSDDAIYEPAKSRLEHHGLMPATLGWDPGRITNALEAVILGMHAKKDNPELLRARELGLKIYSFPEFIYENCRNKIRVVIGGSHGKTTTTAMIMHVLHTLGHSFDYMVGSQVQGFDTMVKLTREAPMVILEGDEYLSSPIDMRPKFHLYRPHIAMITGIAWDHINVFPTFENYVRQFEIFVETMEPVSKLFYFKNDEHLQRIASANPQVQCTGYDTPSYVIDDENTTQVIYQDRKYPMLIFGEHNLQNMEGARMVCNSLAIDTHDFYTAMQQFTGAAKRLEHIFSNDSLTVFRDFAHSPSKLKSTVEAVKQQFKGRKLIAVFELHTFSSLDPNFLPQYANSMDKADTALVFFDDETLKQKNRSLVPSEVKESFGAIDGVFTRAAALEATVNDSIKKEPCVLLLMSSGTFGGLQWKF
jgi:UDP-N-acetylmuramate: L-alanyl-gamma-D-glutamyl-meso-diaminopimelate ligase